MKRVKRVFVANRGEIALRVVTACETLGLQTVVGFSEVDRHGLAARRADRAVCIGPGPAAQSYLRDDVVVQAALGTSCTAIHPGYGFLSESPRLAARAREHGLTFVGPPAEVIELSGDKLRAREEAARAGVPVLPGEEVSSAEQAREVAERIGYPLLVKAAGGGGGRGIKLARDAQELEGLLSLARSEAGAAFGDDRLYLERFIAAARHVEVQIAADEHGAVVHLGERDCSVQRRYQKLIEEAPAPGLEASARDAIRDAAVRFARAIGYRNLGTVEFVVDSDTGEHYFLEINCRIQVEHPVTEAVTGRDLVALQLLIADGEPLGFAQDDVTLEGHSVECRLNAEDVARGFLPTPGTLSLFSVPELPGLRVDTHCHPGAVVPPYYDSLLAKLIAHADDRDAALDVLIEALEELDVEGVETNRTLLISVLGHDDFRRGAVTTDWLARAIV
ncbi:MAG: ATP-grasp domain-containing protein [Solirubrobacterales bacterium]|nr:ATP-grasp domain-containing protein [Solirubrobacterales bacterium]